MIVSTAVRGLEEPQAALKQRAHVSFPVGHGIWAASVPRALPSCKEMRALQSRLHDPRTDGTIGSQQHSLHVLTPALDVHTCFETLRARHAMV